MSPLLPFALSTRVKVQLRVAALTSVLIAWALLVFLPTSVGIYVYPAIVLVAIVLLWVWARPLTRRLAWRRLAGGVAIWQVAGMMEIIRRPNPGSLDKVAVDLIYALGYVFVTMGVYRALEQRRIRDTSARIDASIAFVSAAVPLTVFWLHQFAADASDGWWASASSLVFLTVDLILLAVIARTLINAPRTPGKGFLVGGVVCLLLGDTLFFGNLDSDLALRIASSLYASAYLMMPFAARLGARGLISASDDANRSSNSRLMLLAFSTWTIPATLFALWFADTYRYLLVVAGGTAVVFMLVIARAATLVRTVRAHANELAYQAGHDPLTKLPNRRQFAERLADCEAMYDDHPTLDVAVLYVDLDDFKPINDNLGHDAGDAVLVAVAQRLSAGVRSGDLVARLGGDEFAILAVHCTYDEATQIANRLVDALCQPLEFGGRSIPVSGSVGVAMHAPGNSLEETVHQADVAMVSAKRSGKGRAGTFSDGLDIVDMGSIELRADLRAEIAAGGQRFRMLYQPVIELGTGELIGVEALARWDHPTRGLLTPDQFIGIAEESGLIVPLGRLLVQFAFADFQSSPLPARCRLAVNVSAHQLSAGGFADGLIADAAVAGLRPELVLVEVTETALARDFDELAAALSDLRARGFKIGLDDFGTGFSSLDTMRRLPFDVVKIDRSFVACPERRSRLLLTGMVQLAHAMGARVVAEGVEEPEQAAAVAALGCEFGQGYLYSRPVSLATLCGTAPAAV